MSHLDIPELDTKIHFCSQLSELELDFENSILYYDVNLEQHLNVKAFTELGKFHKVIALKAGEELKSLENIQAQLIEHEADFKSVPKGRPQFICLGGGSLGDFVGFLASVYQRGSQLIQIPSTWLSAIDSSHGGKTALNTKLGKNQIGSFHQASEVFVVEELLFTQPKELFFDALSEIIKMYMLIEDERKFSLAKDATNEQIMATIKHCVEQKYIWVKKDPFEKTGLRQVLNLGHSMGHAFESCMGISHGKAVAMGLCFCLRYSYAKEKLKDERYQRLVSLFNDFEWWPQYKEILSNVSSDKIRSFLLSDKKRKTSGSLNYIFLTDLGHKIEEVQIEELSEFLKKEIMNV